MADPVRPLDDDVLRNAYAAAHAAPPGSHVTDAQWERLACGELDAAELAVVVDHATRCAECAAIHRGVLAVGEGAVSFDPNAVGATRSAPAASWRWSYISGLAAAAAIVAAVVINRPWQTQPDSETVTRSTTATVGVETVAPASGAVLVERRFTWKPVPGADEYEIRINAAAGAVVWTSHLTATSAVVPATVTIAPGSYYWQVTALRDSTPLGSSTILGFRVE